MSLIFSTAHVGFISKNQDKTQRCDKSNMRYLSWPRRLPIDLNQGFETFVENASASSGDIEPLLKWIVEADGGNLHSSADIVCKRGVLKRLASSLNEEREGWRICGARLGNSLYLREYETPQREEYFEHRDEKALRMEYWGSKFEQCVTSATPGGAPQTALPVEAYAEFAIVAKAKLGPHSLLYCGKADCVDDRERYVKLLTYKITPDSTNIFTVSRYKKRYTWLQCHLMGIKHIVVGFRDEDAKVAKLKKYDVADWKPKDGDECLAYLNQLLTKFRDVCAEQYPCVYEFYWNPGEEMGFKKHVGPHHDFRFLSDEYVQHVQSQSEASAAGAGAV